MADPQTAATTAATTATFDIAGARAAGYSDADIAGYLADKSGFDVDGARKAGYDDNDIINHLSPPATDQPLAATLPDSSTAGTLVRGAERGTLPAAGGFASMVGGAKLGMVAGAAIPGLGETGIGEVVGGLVGGFAGNAVVQKAQDAILNLIPDHIREAIGQSKTQEQADELAHPYASMIGELGPNLAFMRPGAAVKAAQMGGTVLARALASPVGARAVGAGLMGTQEAATEAYQDGTIDPVKVGIAAGAGALMNRETRLGEAVRTGIEGVIPGGGAHAETAPAPTSEADATTVMSADSVDDAIKAASDVVASSTVDVGAMAETAKAQGDQNTIAAETRENLEQAQAPVTSGPEEPATVPPEGAQDAVEADKPAVEQPQDAEVVARQTDPAAFQQYDALTARQDSYREWLADLGTQRASQPAAVDAQARIDDILGKVGGVEGRLTNVAADRLASARADLTSAIHSDSPDMTAVRQKLLDVQHKLWDISPDIQTAYSAAEKQAPTRPEPAEGSSKPVAPHTANDMGDVHAQSAAAGEPLSEPESKQIAAQMDDHGLDAKSAVSDHIDRKAIREVYFDHEKTADPAYSPGLALNRRAGTGDNGADQGIEGLPPAAGGEAGAGTPREAVAPDTGREAPGAEKPLATFTTAKGSTYEVHADGTTTRDKAARADIGHEGQSGPQPRSERTVYVTKDQADELGLFQTQGGPKMAVAETADGRVGVKYLDGKDAGMFERRTVARPSEEPAPGLIPVETWKGGTRVHFGNEITEVREAERPQPSAEKVASEPPNPAADTPKPRALVTKNVEGKGDEITRAIGGDTTRALKDEDQIARAEQLVAKDYPKAVEMAMRTRQAPDDVLPAFIYMAVEAKATREGDTDLINRLRTSPFAAEVTTAGRTISALRNRDEYSAVAQIQAVEALKVAAVEKRSGDAQKAKAEAAKETTTQIKRAQKAAMSKRPSWEDFIKQITCAGE